MEATLWFEHLCCGLLSPEAEAWMEKTGGMKFEAGEFAKRTMCGLPGYRYRLVGEESDFSKLNPFLEPKATAGGDCW